MTNPERKRKLYVITLACGLALCLLVGFGWKLRQDLLNERNSLISERKLRTLGIAMLWMEQADKRLPEAAIVAKGSSYPHSWRVAILPYIEQVELYKQYHFDEPWDSENNKKVLQQMPADFRSPLDPIDSTTTSYVLPVGPGTIFDSKFSGHLKDITDGVSNTIMIVESKSDIPWTKPEDLPISKATDIKTIGGFYGGAFLVFFADGATRRVKHPNGQQDTWSLFTASGGDDTYRWQ